MGRKGDARRQQILEAAKKILMESGPEAFVLRDIAEKIGITHGNLQYYFRTRHDLLVAIFDQEVEKYTNSMQESIAATSTRRGRLAAIIDSGLAVLRTPETALWRMIISMADHNEEVSAILKKENDLYEAVLAKELKQIAPKLSPQRRRHVAKIVRAMLDGLAVQFIHEDPESADMKALQTEMKAVIFALVDAD
ncbi:MAG: TetR/AcrR family transcriptional regulator [Steroidobacteraceae bacterium]|jgi:AcrR family transcriptional regulator|nr:TetR/AcrR family transcriptional regulator [Steroidobacteraceae bacterium]